MGATPPLNLGGDVIGPPNANTLSKIDGITLPTPTGSNTVPTYNAGAFTWAASGGGGGGTSVTGTGVWYSASGTLNTAAVTPSGDVSIGALSGSNLPFTVGGLQGRSVSSSAPSTGNTLGWTGSTWTPGALNLAGGSNYVTGTLPVGNLPNLAGDVTGAATSNTVAQITGSSSVANVISGTALTWLTSGHTSSAGGRMNFTGEVAGNILEYHYAGTDYVALNTDGGGNFFIGTGGIPGIVVDAATDIDLTAGGTTMFVLGAGSYTSNSFGVNASGFDQGGGAGLLDLAPVTTTPTALPTTHTGIYTASGQLTGLNSNGITWPYELTGVTVIQQTQAPSTSTGSGSAGNGLTIIAQAGQPATGASNAGGSGGVLLSRSAGGGNSALANGGNAGNSEFGSGTGGAATGGTGNGGNGGNTILFGGLGGTSSGGTAGVNGTVNIRIGGAGGSDTVIDGPNANGTNVFDIVGAAGFHVVTKSASYVVDSGATPDFIINMNSSGGARNVTLPAPSQDRVLFIKDSTGSAATHNISILQHASESIEGQAATYVVSTPWSMTKLYSDGTNWFVMFLMPAPWLRRRPENDTTEILREVA
jgi:hypothetical protein